VKCAAPSSKTLFLNYVLGDISCSHLNSVGSARFWK
jgi:hypothetical protein